MMSESAAGNAVRDYFLDCEAKVLAPVDPLLAIRAGWLALEAECARKDLLIAEQADTIAIMEPAHEVSLARSRSKIHVSTSRAWSDVMGRRKLTREVWDLFDAKLFKRRGQRDRIWREEWKRAGWGCDHDNVHDDLVTTSPHWFERGKLALPLWMAEVDRQAPIPAYLGLPTA